MGEFAGRPCAVLPGRVGIDGLVVQQVALGIEADHLAAGTESGVDGQYPFLPQRRGQQQLLHVLGKDGDGRIVGLLFGRGGKFALDRGSQQSFVAVGHRLPYEGRGFAFALDKEALQASESLFVVGGNRYPQDTLLFAAAHGQNLVRGTSPQRFAPGKVVAVFIALRLFALDHFGRDDTALLEAAAHGVAGPFVFGHPFGHDVAGSLDGAFGVGHLGRNESRGAGLDAVVALRHDDFGQRFETAFAGNLGSGPSAGLVGQIYVFEFGGVPARVDALAQLVGEFALLVDGR